MATTLAKGTSIKSIDSKTYSAFFYPDWCVGTGRCLFCRLHDCSSSDSRPVPHGGYVTSCFMSVVKLHFGTTLASSDQPHTIALQLNFIRRNWSGPATFTVSELKLGRRTSTIHVALTQGNADQPPSVVGYFTQSNIDTESGVSLPSVYSLEPSPPSPPSTAALRRDTDRAWILHHKPFSNFRKAGQHVITYLPRNGQVGQALVDQWLTLADGERFTQESLGYVVDTFPQIVETSSSPENQQEMKRVRNESDYEGLTSGLQSRAASNSLDKSQWALFWYPTVLLNLEIKKALPPEGVEWLFSRVRAKKIKNGRMDLEVIILDEQGDIVALSHHVALIVGAERNMDRSNKDNRRGQRL